ncbi:MAG: fumarate hydratase [Thermoleophilia bacterium]
MTLESGATLIAKSSDAVRDIDVERVAETIAGLCLTTCCDAPEDVTEALRSARETELSGVGREILDQLLENAAIAAERRVPLCQDTGFAVVFADVGQDVHFVGGDFIAAVNEGVRRGYRDGFLRKSIVAEPAHARRNTGDNTPAIVHTRLVPGRGVRLTLMAKGGGAENMSALAMLKPSDGWAGVAQTVVETVSRAGSNPCPPTIVGVGIGGTIEMVTLLAKRALLREIGSRHRDPRLAELEDELLVAVNALGIGPQGLGGSTTSLAVFIEEMPCHIASMPVAVNVQCHAQRHRTAVL